MEIDILIDGLTNCLIDRATGEELQTEYRLRTAPVKPSDYKGWNFNWSEPEKNGYQIYELFLEGDDTVQGRIAIKIDGGVGDIDIVENAPHNFSSKGKYQGVGGHLFAIACQISLDNGCGGFVAFTAKSKLIDYYAKELNAKVFRGQRMFIDEAAAQILLDKYMRK